MTTVNTKHAERRTLRFESLADVVEDAARLTEADQAGTLRTTGNWSAGQNFDHVGKLMQWSIDGFPGKLPLPLRIVGKFMKKRALTTTAPPGFKIPGSASFLLPADIPTEDGLGLLRTQVSRVQAGERCSHASPLLGTLSHDEWVQLHCRHAELHFSFLHPE